MITAIPYALAAAGMVLVGRRSDRTGERHLHLALPALTGALGFIAVTRIGSTGPLIAALCVTAFGVLAWLGPFWSLPTAFLKEQAAAGGISGERDPRRRDPRRDQSVIARDGILERGGKPVLRRQAIVEREQAGAAP